MARIEDEIGKIVDPVLRATLFDEVKKLKTEKRFGLVFEEHLPELVPVYGAKVKARSLVARRGRTFTETFKVVRVHEGMAEVEKNDGSRESISVDELTVVRRFGEPIYPALRPFDRVKNGDTSQPHHILIEADNYHALQLLEYCYSGKVDCIYIDPPYNTGSKDWKYNNDYVDGNDTWRHSKWLSMMNKRLNLAKYLLNPDSSMLIVTIDEKEYLRLGLLLKQVFAGCKIQMTSIVINPKGTARYNEFSRVEEYAFFVFIGGIRLQSFGSDMLTERDYASETHVRWRGLARTGRKGLRSNNPGSWYPIFLNESDFSIHSIGDAIWKDVEESSVAAPKGTIAVWPPSKNGQQYSWSSVPETLRSTHAKGGFKTGRVNHGKKQYPFYYLSSGSFEKIAKGEIVITGRGPSNELIVEFAEGLKSAAPRTIWNQVIYDAGSHGTGVLQQILPGGKFPFPKSIYAVRDSIRFFVANKSDAIVVDFFAGSGTTLNAVNLLNATDNGKRQCILVTNNEVSEDEAKSLTEQGHKPGSDEWNTNGICQSVTFPRSKYTMLGRRDDGSELEGEYLTGRTVTKEKARTFKQLGFVEGRLLSLAQRKQLVALIDKVPQSKIMADMPFFVDEEIPASILFDIRQAEAWLEALEEQEHITDFYLVTQENRAFTSIKQQVQELLGPVLLEEEEKRPLKDGFPANLEYFKLDFLDPTEVQMGRQFAAILPVLWMMAGTRGSLPDAPDPHAPWLIPADCPFAVLIQEKRFKEFHRHIEGRDDLTHVFIVTNSSSTYHNLREEIKSPHVVQLYRDYLQNFKINYGKD